MGVSMPIAGGKRVKGIKVKAAIGADYNKGTLGTAKLTIEQRDFSNTDTFYISPGNTKYTLNGISCIEYSPNKYFFLYTSMIINASGYDAMKGITVDHTSGEAVAGNEVAFDITKKWNQLGFGEYGKPYRNRLIKTKNGRIFAIVGGNTGDFYVHEFEINDNLPSLLKKTMIGTGWEGYYYDFVELNNDKFLLYFWGTTSDNACQFAILDLSGDEPSIGDKIPMPNSTYRYYFYLRKLSNTLCVLLAWDSGSNKPMVALPISIDGMSVTLGTITVIGTGDTAYSNDRCSIVKDESTIWIKYGNISNNEYIIKTNSVVKTSNSYDTKGGYVPFSILGDNIVSSEGYLGKYLSGKVGFGKIGITVEPSQRKMLFSIGDDGKTIYIKVPNSVTSRTPVSFETFDIKKLTNYYFSNEEAGDTGAYTLQQGGVDDKVDILVSKELM